jgi:aminomethyltransferase
MFESRRPERSELSHGTYLTLTNRSMAIARLSVDAAQHGKKLKIRGKNVQGGATAHTLPFDDPQKKKRTALG